MGGFEPCLLQPPSIQTKMQSHHSSHKTGGLKLPPEKLSAVLEHPIHQQTRVVGVPFSLSSLHSGASGITRDVPGSDATTGADHKSLRRILLSRHTPTCAVITPLRTRHLGFEITFSGGAYMNKGGDEKGAQEEEFEVRKIGGCLEDRMRAGIYGKKHGFDSQVGKARRLEKNKAEGQEGMDVFCSRWRSVVGHRGEPHT
ncbi:hypothetical protein BT69DRAFT_1364298 [Atractiella rhizophila]|nr:hypothetical protein BT69DRAFT_1364298 [Atractiella rhizophila]